MIGEAVTEHVNIHVITPIPVPTVAMPELEEPSIAARTAAVAAPEAAVDGGEDNRFHIRLESIHGVLGNVNFCSSSVRKIIVEILPGISASW